MDEMEGKLALGLLAVDLGVKTGLAYFGGGGRLLWYKSQNFGSRARLRKGVPGILRKISPLSHLLAEGDRTLGEVWTREAERLGAQVRIIGAETWRADVLYARHRRSGEDAKRFADTRAREIIEISGAPRPKGALKHDAAEAILVGYWGVTQLGWVKASAQR